jgi:hypothetical protein
VAEVAPSREDHRHVVPVGDLDRHLVADRAAGLDDRRDAGLGRDLDSVREREVGVAGHDREPRPVAGPPQGDFDGDWRLAWAAPIPTVAPPRARTIAFERTWRTARQANSRSVSSSSVGRRLVTTWSWRLVEPQLVLGLDQQAAGDALEVEVGDAVVARALDRVGGTASSSICGFWARMPSADWLNDGATTASYELAAISRAVAPSSSRLTPTMPPKHETASVSSALRQASTSSSAEASPTGSVCLTIVTVGAVKSAAMA